MPRYGVLNAICPAWYQCERELGDLAFEAFGDVGQCLLVVIARNEAIHGLAWRCGLPRFARNDK